MTPARRSRACFDQRDYLEMTEDAAAVEAWDLFDMFLDMARHAAASEPCEWDLGGEG